MITNRLNKYLKFYEDHQEETKNYLMFFNSVRFQTPLHRLFSFRGLFWAVTSQFSNFIK